MLRQRVLHLEHQRNQAWQEVKRLAKEPYRQDEESASLLPPEVRDIIMDQAMLSTSPRSVSHDQEWNLSLAPTMVAGSGPKNEPGAEAPAQEESMDPLAWVESGHRWIGQRITRDFGEYGTNTGIIKAWVPAGEDTSIEPALWHVEYDDGDDEDLEAHEVHAALELHRKSESNPERAGRPSFKSGRSSVPPAGRGRGAGGGNIGVRVMPGAGPGHWSRRPGIPQPLGPRHPAHRGGPPHRQPPHRGAFR